MDGKGKHFYISAISLTICVNNLIHEQLFFSYYMWIPYSFVGMGGIQSGLLKVYSQICAIISCTNTGHISWVLVSRT